MKKLFCAVLVAVLCLSAFGFTACTFGKSDELIWRSADLLTFCNAPQITTTFPPEEGSRNVTINADVYNVAVHNIEGDQVKVDYTENAHSDVDVKFDETTETVHITQNCTDRVLTVNVFLGLVVGIPQSWTDFTLQVNVSASNLSLEDSKAKTIKIDGDACSIKMNVLDDFNQSTEIETDAGSVDFSGSTKTLDVKVNAGTITTHNIFVDQLKLATSTGTINVNGDNGGVNAQTIDLSTKTGSINLNGSADTIIAQTNTGSINADILSADNLQLTTKTGSINFTADNALKINLESNTGSINGTIKVNKSWYTINVTQSSGSCNISNQVGTDDDRQLTVKAGTGSIKIKFN